MTDLVPSRLKFAQSLVPTVQTVQIEREWTDLQTAAEITKAAGGQLRVALECTGFEGSIRAAIFVSPASLPTWKRDTWAIDRRSSVMSADRASPRSAITVHVPFSGIRFPFELHPTPQHKVHD